MTPEEQRIAIAEWMGEQSICNRCGDRHLLTILKCPECGTQYEQVRETIPDYLNDLNAMHEAENKLGDTPTPHYSQRDVYSLNLLKIVAVWAHKEGFDWLDHCDADFFRVANATAAQRAEALCRTLWPERWKE